MNININWFDSGIRHIISLTYQVAGEPLESKANVNLEHPNFVHGSGDHILKKQEDQQEYGCLPSFFSRSATISSTVTSEPSGLAVEKYVVTALLFLNVRLCTITDYSVY